MAYGIEALHDKNIMHRDISPGNILFDDSWTVKICDFGFCKPDNDTTQSTGVGTPAFRDPKIQAGKYSKKCDIFSAGLIMDYIFRGEALLRNGTEEENKKQYIHFLHNKAQLIQSVDSPDELKKLILKCIESEEMGRVSAS